MKELIDQIGGRERLDALIDDEDCRVTVVEQELLAQIALAVLDAQQNPFMFAISDCDGKAHFDECCVSAHGCDLEDVVGSLNDFREGVDDGYSIVPVYTFPPAAIVTDVKPVFMPKSERINNGYYFDMDDIFVALDAAGVKYKVVK